MKALPDLRAFRGISRSEAVQRLMAGGYNEIQQAKPPGRVAMAFSALREPMVLLLLVCAAIYLSLGDLREGLIMFTTVFVVGGIEFYQRQKTERTMEQLRQYSSPRALVIRDGEEMRIAGREVVTGDIVIVREGDRVPADAVVLFELNLGVDESLLTGESHPVAKTEGTTATLITPPGGDVSASLYSGTLVVQGQAVALVAATGEFTQMGLLGKTLAAIPDEKSALQKETGRIVAVFAVVAFILCSAVVVTFAIRYSNWLKGFLAGTALALSMLPEEFPVALTIFLAVGAWRIARKNVMTRVPAALEILGATSVLCSDKTGTITENRMRLTILANDSDALQVDYSAPAAELPESYHEVLEYAILASQANPYDPMEKAILSFGNTALAGSEHLHGEWNLFKEYPLSRSLLAISRAFKNSQGGFVIAAKGAPEAVFDLCHLNPEAFAEQTGRVTEFAKKGLRVIAVAKALPGKDRLPEIQHDFEFEFLGLLGFKDPVRAGVPDSIAACAKAGIRVIMITGDHPATAAHIAREIQIADCDRVLTGNMLREMSAAELKDNIRRTNVFARISPDQKLQIVRALKENAATVIMTGDGVNDAPALKAADIGIAMGGKGTDVAREAAKLVLLDDDFSNIVKAISLGRRIVANLRKAFSFIVASHIPIAAVALIPVLFPDLPVILFPVHIVFLELIIDPACTLAFENEENPRIMDAPLDATQGRFFDLRSITLSFLQGVSVTAAVVAVYFTTRYTGYSENVSRALTFATLIMGNIFLILSNASASRFALNPAGFRNPALRWIIIAAILLLAVILYLPGIREVFRFESPDFISLALCAACAFAGILWFEVLKYWRQAQRARGISI